MDSSGEKSCLNFRTNKALEHRRKAKQDILEGKHIESEERFPQIILNAFKHPSGFFSLNLSC